MTLNTEIQTEVGVAHPLDPLSREEISRAACDPEGRPGRRGILPLHQY